MFIQPLHGQLGVGVTLTLIAQFAGSNTEAIFGTSATFTATFPSYIVGRRFEGNGKYSPKRFQASLHGFGFSYHSPSPDRIFPYKSTSIAILIASSLLRRSFSRK